MNDYTDTAAAIAACGMCDEHGRRDDGRGTLIPCDHVPRPKRFPRPAPALGWIHEEGDLWHAES